MQAQVKEWENNQETRLSKDIRKSAGIELNENLDVKFRTASYMDKR